MKVKTYLLFIIIALLVSGCIARASEPISTSVPELLPSLTIPSTSPPLVAVSPTSPTLNANQVREQCLSISIDSSHFQSQNLGSLVIQQDLTTSVLYEKLDTPYLYTVATGEKTPLLKASRFAVSLNNEQLAYITEDEQLIITDSSGKIVVQRPYEGVGIWGWARDGLFVDLDNQGKQSFLNPFTGEYKPLTYDYPNLYPVERGWQPYWHPAIIYSPDLTRVVFAGWDESKLETYIVLWDVQGEKELTRVSQGEALSIAPETKPEWSSDSQQVILQTFGVDSVGNADRKLISIHNDGSVHTLLPLNGDIATMRYSLSPDQTRVAFWSPDPSSTRISNVRLYILDIETGDVVNYCLVSPEISGKPIWSPDSQNLVVELLMSDLENSEVVVVDIKKGVAVKIADDAKPVGWLK